uniref:TerD domain-containing protein n=1 Tax=Macrostomum lignano TaxID=282301 RepID=A0A1I8JRB8_9PLAT
FSTEDTIGFDWIGARSLPCLSATCATAAKSTTEIHLQPKNFAEALRSWEQEDRGKIMIGLCYAPAKSGADGAAVIQCVNLIAMDANGYSDPLRLSSGTAKRKHSEITVWDKDFGPTKNDFMVLNPAFVTQAALRDRQSVPAEIAGATGRSSSDP